MLDAKSGRELLVKKLEHSCPTVAFSPDGKHLAVAPFAVATEGKYVRILKAETGELVKNCPWSNAHAYQQHPAFP